MVFFIFSDNTHPYQNFKDVQVYQLCKALERMSILTFLQDISIEKEGEK